MSTEYTEEEVREKFLKSVWSNLNYWKNESRAKTIDEKMEGFAFSFLAMLDGENGVMPKFIVAPNPNPEDKKYYIQEGENYFPENYLPNVKSDISGCLHEEFQKYKK